MTRFNLVLAGFSIAMIVVAVVLSRTILVQTAVRSDEDLSRKTLNRGMDVLIDDKEALLRTVTDWASGDDIYSFMMIHNQDYLDSNLVEGAIKRLRLHVILYFDTNRQEVATLAVDSNGHRQAAPSEWLKSQVLRSDGILDRLRKESSLAGFLVDNNELWLVAAAPILSSRNSGLPRGTLLMARHIDASEMERLARLIHTSLVLGTADASWPPGRTEIRALSPRTLAARTVVADVFGNGRVLLDLTMSRAAFEQTSRSLLYLAIWIAVCGITVTIFSFWFLDHWILRSVTDSVATLRAGIAVTTSTNGKHTPLMKIHADEIGELIDAVNAALAAFDASQEHIRASETCYRVLVETMPEAIAGVDQDNHLLFANRALARLTGVSSQEDLIGRHLQNVLSPAFSEAIIARLPELATGHPIEMGPLAVKTTGSEDRWVMAFLATVEPAPDLPAYTLICMRDITAKLNAEHEADQRRTEAMHAQKLAALGTLVAGVAHEVNNPNGIVNLNMNVLRRILERRFTELATSDGGTTLKQEMITIVLETLAASKRIAGLVASLKNFARPEVNTPVESVEIEELIRRSAAWVRHDINKRHCRLECEPSAHGLRVRGHAQQLQQVCINLLHNACEATDRPDAIIRVGATLDPDGQTVTLTVSDEGRGIPQESLDHVFDPFFTTRRGEGGLGLGLSISAAIATAHGGTLRIKSAVGKGTLVTLTLPVDKEVQHAG